MLFVFDLFALYLIPTDYSSRKIVPMEEFKNKIDNVNIPYIDPLLEVNSDNNIKFLMMFRSFEDMQEAVPKLPNYGIKILHQYRLIPAVFVEGRVSNIIEDIHGFAGITGLYANRIYQIPKYYKGVTQKQISIPTTNDTAYLMGANVFWENNYKGDDVIVAVIDTGVDKNHRELSGKVLAEKSFVRKIYGYDVDVPSPHDEEGHGTAVAGIIAGKGLDPRGQGMAPNALILNAKVFTRGSGATLAGIVAAIEWATFGPDGIPNTGDEADVINMSLGGGEIYNSPTWRAVKAATEHGVVVVIAAGNEGQDQKNSMSVGDPGDSPWAITAGAADPFYTGLDKVSGEEYSSFGPTIALAVKPDIAAPSGTIVIAAGDGYTGSPWHGTSFSSPHTAGAAALIVNYLREHGVNKSEIPWLVKPLMMLTASPLYANLANERIKYEDLMVGAGVLNLTAAYELLQSSTISSDSYPQWMYVLPTKIPVGLSNSQIDKYKLHRPYFPYFSKVFNGQNIFMNFTIVASKNTTIQVTYTGNFTNAIQIHSDSTINVNESTCYWEFNFTVLEDAVEGHYEGLITFSDEVYGITINVPIEFDLVNPAARVLFDLKHTSWEIDYRYGQYRLLAGYWEGMDVSIDTLVFGSKTELSESLLEKYDVLFMPDTAAAVGIFDEKAMYLGYTYIDITWDEISAIYDFVANGGTVVIFALDPEAHNLTTINEVLTYTESELYYEPWGGKDTTVSADVISDNILMSNILGLPYQGIQMRVGSNSEPILRYDNYELAMIHQGFSGGAIIALGTNFMFDNWAFLGEYPNSSYTPTFAKNIISFASDWKNIISSVNIANLDNKVMLGSSLIITNDTFGALEFEATNTTPLINATIEIYNNDTLLAKSSFTYDDVDGVWKATVAVSGGYKIYSIKIKAYFEQDSTVYSVTRGGEIIIDEENPSITPVTLQIMTQSNRTAHVKTLFGDDCAIKPDTLVFSVNMSEFTTDFYQVNRTHYILDIEIPEETLQQFVNEGRRMFTVAFSAQIEDYFGRSTSSDLTYRVLIDDTPPQVAITNIRPEQYLSGTVTLNIEANDDMTGINLIILYVDGKMLGNESGASMTYELNTKQYADGLHNISVSAIDGAGNEKIETIQVYIDNTKPTLNVTGVENGTTVSGIITLNITASDELSGIQNISVALDNQTINSTEKTSLTININTTQLTEGEHIIEILTYDRAGNSNSVKIIINVEIKQPIEVPMILIGGIIAIIVIIVVVFILQKKGLLKGLKE